MKRAFDVSFSLSCLTLLSPLMCILAVMVPIQMGKPILFKQTRPGLNGKPFTIYKFRTMRDLRDQEGRLLPDEERLTPFGCWMRKYSLDELPQLFNVVKGDLSVVGPRPLLMSYLPLYSPEQARRHEVKPGITGWAQVNGRNALSWEEKFALDVWYVDHWSLLLDVKILWMTVIQVFHAEGISMDGYVGAPLFTGQKEKATRANREVES